MTASATYIWVDEKGIEAAAVTDFAVITTGSPAAPPPESHVDAPFVFKIHDEVTGALLFVAQIGDPSDGGR